MYQTARCVGWLLLVLGTPFAQASYRTLTFGELLGGADVIVLGSIARASSPQLEVDVEECWVGHLDGKKINIQQFENWTCASRWTEYRSGQRILFFLTRIGPSSWRIMGAGDEGEMPVLDDSIYPSIFMGKLDFGSERFTVYGGTRIQKQPLATFKAAIQDTYPCFRFVRGGQHWNPRGVHQVCTNQVLSECRKRSDMHRALVDSVRFQAGELERLWRSHCGLDAQESAKAEARDGQSLGWALDIAEGFGDGDWRLAATLKRYASFLRSQGQAEAARTMEERAAAMKAAPRINRITVCGENAVVEREGQTLEVFEIATGKLLGRKVLDDYYFEHLWTGHALCLSPDGRQVAYCPHRETPIKVVSLYGEEPKLASFTAPAGIAVGPGGFTPLQLRSESMIVVSNTVVAELGLASGAVIRQCEPPAIWPWISPNGKHLINASCDNVFWRPPDKTREQSMLWVASRLDPSAKFSRKLGMDPDETVELLGRDGLYLTAGFMGQVRFQPYQGGEPHSFSATNVNVVAESADAGLAAFRSPAIEETNWEWDFFGSRTANENIHVPTTVQIWDTAKSIKIGEIDRHCFLKPMFGGKGQLICAQLASDRGSRWWSDHVLIFDARSGEFQKELILSE